MKNFLISFLSGVVTGVVLGAMVREEDKRKIKRMIQQQSSKLWHDYEASMKGSADKVKQMVKNQLS